MRGLGGDHDFDVERNGAIHHAEENAIRNREKQRVQTSSSADIKPGDWLIAKPSGNRIYVHDIEIIGKGSSLESLVAYYETEDDLQRKKVDSHPGDTYNVETAYGSLFGRQSGDFRLDNSFNFGDLYQQIEQNGGADRAALLQMVEEIRAEMDRGEPVEASGLARFSELINRHASWLASPLAHMMLLYSITGSVSGS